MTVRTSGFSRDCTRRAATTAPAVSASLSSSSSDASHSPSRISGVSTPTSTAVLFFFSSVMCISVIVVPFSVSEKRRKRKRGQAATSLRTTYPRIRNKAYLLLASSLFLNLSTLPPASTNFCLPVKKGWHFEQISTLISPPFGLVERVRTVSPQAHRIVTSSYLGWIPSFTFNTSLRIKMLPVIAITLHYITPKRILQYFFMIFSFTWHFFS